MAERNTPARLRDNPELRKEYPPKRLSTLVPVLVRRELRRLLPNSVALHLPWCEVAWISWVPSAHQLHRLPAVPVFVRRLSRLVQGTGA